MTKNKDEEWEEAVAQKMADKLRPVLDDLAASIVSTIKDGQKTGLISLSTKIAPDRAERARAASQKRWGGNRAAADELEKRHQRLMEAHTADEVTEYSTLLPSKECRPGLPHDIQLRDVQPTGNAIATTLVAFCGRCGEFEKHAFI